MTVKINARLKSVTGQFFDSAAVIRKTNAAERRILSRFGAFVRRRSRSSIRSRKNAVSSPGNPPFSKVGTLKKLIFFSYDTNRKSVVIGPTKVGKGEAPRTLEEGGLATSQVLVLEKIPRSKELRIVTNEQVAKPVFRASRNAPRKRIKIRPRPYMGPAFNAELPSVRSQLANSIR